MKIRIFIIAVAAIALSSCSGTKNLAKPETEIPASYAENRVDSICIADLSWMEFYSDPVLGAIIQKALDNNKDILKAAARVEELRQLYGVDKLNYLPQIDGLIGVTNETNDYHNASFKKDREISVKPSLNWEVEFWGGLSHAQKKSSATYIASVFDKRALQMTIIAEAASAYFHLVALENELNIVKKTISTRKQALEKARLRFEGGLTSEIVYQQSKVELASTEALVPGLVKNINIAKNAIYLIMGELPKDELKTHPTVFREDLPETLPVGIPSQLIERRPDLKASEQRLKVALANVGIGYSNQFPKLTIKLTGGVEQDEMANLFRSPFSYILGNITGTIFDFGRKHRKYKSLRAAYDQARFDYEKSVLTAFTEVNNAVITAKQTAENVTKRKELRDAALKYVNLANTQYIGGTINYIDVLDAQRHYFDAQINLSNAMRDQYLALVNLYKALGGGWNIGEDSKKIVDPQQDIL